MFLHGFIPPTNVHIIRVLCTITNPNLSQNKGIRITIYTLDLWLQLHMLQETFKPSLLP